MPKILRRYTDLPSLLRLLHTRSITLLDPSSWDDKNDSEYLKIYKSKKGLASVLALCFTEASETYHHWKIFAPGSGGVCITFDKLQLLGALENQDGIQHRLVEYRTLDILRAIRPCLNDLPYLKRWAFSDEAEYRVIYESQNESLKAKDFQVPLSSILQVSLSPWLPKPLAPSVKSTIRSLFGSDKFKVYQTTLNENSSWKKAGNSAA